MDAYTVYRELKLNDPGGSLRFSSIAAAQYEHFESLVSISPAFLQTLPWFVQLVQESFSCPSLFFSLAKGNVVETDPCMMMPVDALHRTALASTYNSSNNGKPYIASLNKIVPTLPPHFSVAQTSLSMDY